MAFVPGFEYDIFISYAHVDNQMATSEAAGWVETFHKNLRIRLSQRFGRDGLVAIWRDENLTGDQLFDQVIKPRKFEKLDRPRPPDKDPVEWILENVD
jgi:hypothetical protein